MYRIFVFSLGVLLGGFFGIVYGCYAVYKIIVENQYFTWKGKLYDVVKINDSVLFSKRKNK